MPNSVRAQGSPEKALEWDAGPVAETLEKFKKEKIERGILAQVCCRNLVSLVAFRTVSCAFGVCFFPSWRRFRVVL